MPAHTPASTSPPAFDDLTAIRGVGEVLERWLRGSVGVQSFAELAALSPRRLEQRARSDGRALSAARIGEILMQARELAASEAQSIGGACQDSAAGESSHTVTASEDELPTPASASNPNPATAAIAPSTALPVAAALPPVAPALPSVAPALPSVPGSTVSTGSVPHAPAPWQRVLISTGAVRLAKRNDNANGEPPADAYELEHAAVVIAPLRPLWMEAALNFSLALSAGVPTGGDQGMPHGDWVTCRVFLHISTPLRRAVHHDQVSLSAPANAQRVTVRLSVPPLMAGVYAWKLIIFALDAHRGSCERDLPLLQVAEF